MVGLYESIIIQLYYSTGEQIGGSQAALDMAVNYANERYAFGKPIGSYQGIKHKLADMYVALTLANLILIMLLGHCHQNPQTYLLPYRC